LDVFFRAPTAENLHAYETNLEDESLVVKQLRPWVQYAQFALLSDAGEKVLIGRDGWLFYRPGLRCLTERPALSSSPIEDPLPAIVSFRDQLAERGIGLVVVVAPDKESIYPEMLTGKAGNGGVVVSPQTRELIERMRLAGVGLVDLFAAYRQAKQAACEEGPKKFFMAADSHWSPEGLRVAADAVAQRVLEIPMVQPGPVCYAERPVEVARPGDLIQMLHSPQLERSFPPEKVTSAQVVREDNGTLYRDDPSAEVLVLGDSFLRIFQQDEPRAAGFIAHLARRLKQPLASLVCDGGASTLVRQILCRRTKLLSGKKLVIWEFVERDIRLGTDGWQVITLPR